MNHCKDCKWSELYFRGLICRWVDKNRVPKMPEYLFKQVDTTICHPYHLDNKNLANECLVYEEMKD